MRDIILLIARRSGRLGRGKLTRRVYLPPFRRAITREGGRLFIYNTEEHLRSRPHQDPAVIMVYNEIYRRRARALESVVTELYPDALIFNSARTAKIIRDKRAANRAFKRAGIPVPKLVQTADTRVFSNALVGSKRAVSLHAPGEQLDSTRYNAEFINTVHRYRGRDYFVCLRAMCVADRLVSVYVRAKPTSDGPSVHNADTPLDPELINHLHFTVVLPRMPEVLGLCRQLSRVLGLGFYAHDLLPCVETGKLYVCESGFKFNDMSLRKHLAPIAKHLAIADFLDETEATRSAYAFLNVLADPDHHHATVPIELIHRNAG